jgi:hypothetical protein
MRCFAEEDHSFPLSGGANHILGFTRFVVDLLYAQVPYHVYLCAARERKDRFGSESRESGRPISCWGPAVCE